MIRTAEGKFITGGQDAIRILHNENSDTYHAAFFREKPFPGSYLDPQPVTRIASSMVHTEGSPTLEGAKQHVAELREQLILSDRQVNLDPIPWDGEPMILIVPVERDSDRILSEPAVVEA